MSGRVNIRERLLYSATKTREILYLGIALNVLLIYSGTGLMGFMISWTAVFCIYALATAIVFVRTLRAR